MRRITWRIGVLMCAVGLMLIAGTARAWQEPDQDQDPNLPAGAQVLTQGPIHEAFAEPVLFDPKPGPVVPKAPPAAIKEVPPEQKPEGDNVQWIPGYWAWDDGRKDFIWVSGVWRAVPPGRQYVPGYWEQVEGGYRWVPGYWGATDAQQLQYLPEPPASLENGPASPPPQPDATWSPGSWVWQDDQYAWQPGFWVQNQPGWMWTPASYSWTPSGYLYNPGFWDYPLANRGMPFAPVYFSQSGFGGSNFAYTPSVGLLTSALLSSLFVRPSYGSYYFGDYYGANNFQSGIYPWYSFHGSRYGYDPLYSYAAAQNLRSNPRWAEELHQTYAYRREHPEARPPHTLAETRRIAARPTAGANAVPGGSSLVLARPLNQLASSTRNAPTEAAKSGGAGASSTALRFQQIDEARRKELASQAAKVHQFREERLKQEQEARRTAGAGARPALRKAEAPRSPIAAARQTEGARTAPPALPQHPKVDRSVRTPPPNAGAMRHEPHPDIRPPASFVPPQQRQAPPQQRPQQQPPRTPPGQPPGRPRGRG